MKLDSYERTARELFERGRDFLSVIEGVIDKLQDKMDEQEDKQDEAWCTCGAKTPQGQFHKLGCPARTKYDAEHPPTRPSGDRLPYEDRVRERLTTFEDDRLAFEMATAIDEGTDTDKELGEALFASISAGVHASDWAQEVESPAVTARMNRILASIYDVAHWGL